MRALRLVLLLAALATPGSAWDPFGIGGSIKKKIEEAGDHQIGNAKVAFEQAMQNLFDQDINPLIDKVNAMVLEDVGVIKQDVEQVVANATHEIEGLIDHAAAVAQSIMDREIEEIQKRIIDETAAKVNECTDHFFHGVDSVLQKFYEVVQKTNCMVQGDIDKVYEDVYKSISTGCLLPDKCCRDGGVAFKTLKGMGDSQLYTLEVCRRTSGLTPTTPALELRKAYMDCQITAKKFFCIDFGTGSARDYFTQEYNKWGVKYNFWTHPVLSDGVLAAGAVQDDPCGSPVDCYQQAIAKLNEARQEIKDKADQVTMDPLVAAQKAESVLQEAELKLFYGQSCPDGWTESPVTKGYLLAGRPDGGTSGTQLNTPLKHGELGRVGPHGHSVHDPGHIHGVHDPGHHHTSEMRGGTNGAKSAAHDTSGAIDNGITTGDAATGASLLGAQSGVSVPMGVATGLDSTEHYPLSYVLVCQRKSGVRSASVPVVV